MKVNREEIDIIEKLGISKNWQPTESLGITKGICFEVTEGVEEPEPENLLMTDIEGYCIFQKLADRNVCLKAPKMLKALIEMEMKLENEPGGWGYFNEMMRDVIQEACHPMTWEEIKGILDGK